MADSSPPELSLSQGRLLPLIQMPESYDSDASFVDVQVHLDLADAAPRNLKALGIPYDYAVFLPLSWDVPRREGKSIEPEEYLRLKELAPAAGVSSPASQLRAAGSDIAVEVYTSVREALDRGLRDGTVIAPTSELQPLQPNSELRISRLKLFLATLQYTRRAVLDADARDRLQLLLDKLLLLTLLSPLFKALLKAFVPPAPPPDTLVKLDDAIVANFRAENPGLLDANDFISSAVTSSEHDLVVPYEQWSMLFAHLKGWPAGQAQVLMPIGFLEDLTRKTLDDAFRQLTSDPAAKDWSKVAPLVEADRTRIQAQEPWAVPRRRDYGFFYQAIDKLWPTLLASDPRQDLNVYKLRYRGQGQSPALPFVQEIDMRPTFWAREASTLSLELALAQRQRTLALERLNNLKAADFPKGPESAQELEAAAHDARVSNRVLADVRRRIELLRGEVTDAGFKLDDAKGDPLLASKELQVLREYWTTREIRINRSAVRTWNETYVERVRIKLGPITIGHRPVYRTRTRSETYNWVEVVQQRYLDTQVATQGARPLADYMDKVVDPGIFNILGPNGRPDTTATAAYKKVVAESVRLPDPAKVDQMRNRDKDVRILSLHATGYRDQYGVSLEKLLAEAEDESRRARLLLLLPMHERRLDGATELVKYVAVHNPVAPRSTYVEPRVFLVETYKHTLTQQPGHWMGALSHTVCLFPGELRRVKLVSETRLVTHQRQENRVAQRSVVEQKTSARQQVRNELMDMRRNGKQSNWNANASGGVNLGFVSFGGGGGGGQQWTSSNETMSKQLMDRVGESLQAVSSSNEVQVASLSETSLTQASSSEQLVEFHNVNQGRSVTHKFFQVLHRFEARVALHDLRVVVEYGEQLIPGFDVFRTEVFKLDQLHQAFPELLPDERARALERMRKLIIERLEANGVKLKPQDGTLLFEPQELERRNWFVNSGACFVDTEVATQPATEPYVEEARKAEIAQQLARAERLKREGDALLRGTLVLPAEVDRMQVALGERGDGAPSTGSQEGSGTNKVSSTQGGTL